MTTCSECLQALSSARLSDIGPGSAIAVHCSTCARCTRVADEVRYAEYRLAASLNEQRPRFPSEEVAFAAIDGSEFRRRRRIARWVRGVLVLIGLGLFGGAMEALLEDDASPTKHLLTETVRLNCLTGKQAAELVTPYLRARGSVVYHAEDLRTVTIRGTSEELAEVAMTLKEIDNPVSCTVSPPGTPAPTPATSDATPGKD